MGEEEEGRGWRDKDWSEKRTREREVDGGEEGKRRGEQRAKRVRRGQSRGRVEVEVGGTQRQR